MFQVNQLSVLRYNCFFLSENVCHNVSGGSIDVFIKNALFARHCVLSGTAVTFNMYHRKQKYLLNLINQLSLNKQISNNLYFFMIANLVETELMLRLVVKQNIGELIYYSTICANHMTTTQKTKMSTINNFTISKDVNRFKENRHLYSLRRPFSENNCSETPPQDTYSHTRTHIYIQSTFNKYLQYNANISKL
ncbi:hypothetical protein AGLY_014140 [Aphis glycines]|uniref:Uncharacterized protein n=1 Tax=Aphis glycines TaxID=307491 RepID=A0A6G0T4L1_APHGL|nr:hypothetical protein AGLY_014140 [Aphis glycines]